MRRPLTSPNVAFPVGAAQVEELWEISKETLDALKPVFGLIFLFKYKREVDERPTIPAESVPDLFFARQMINNACATQAIVNVLLNRKDLDLGADLSSFREFTGGLTPELRGIALDEVKRVRTAHNSFARPEPFVFEDKSKRYVDDDDAFHFIAYVSHGGMLYELDGLKEGPIVLDACEDATWTDTVIPHVQERMARYTGSEIRFNLMALVGSRRDYWQEQASQRSRDMLRVQAKLAALAQGGAAPAADELPADAAGLQALGARLENELAHCQAQLHEEEDKRRRWSVENIRRKHNYIPFIFNCLKVLAEKGQLLPLVDAAARKQAAAMVSKK